MLRVNIQQVKMMKQPHSASIPSPQPKLVCKGECNITACSDPKSAECIVVPISVKPEPDLDPYFLSLELPSRESEISLDDQKMKFDLLNLKLEIKSELSTEEHISFDVAEMIVDPFKDCLVKPENEQVHNHDIPEHSEKSLGAFSEESMLYPTPQAKDHNISEASVLNETEGLNQEGRVCHRLRYRSQVQKRHVKQLQHSEKETCEAKTKQKNSTTQACSLCGNIFANSNSLRVHMRIHTGEKPYVCSTCGKAFAHSHWLKDHTRIHTGQKKPDKMQRFPCSKCDKTFSRAHGLRYHMRRHTRERPYACYLCEKRFINVSDLNQHIKGHSNIRPFVCTECGNSFHRRCTLEKHQRIHTGERPYNCPECGKALRYKYSLTMHMKTHKKG
ncbi:zinc finger protein with KRAB and SCAN domains 8-like [Clupea harengus]|uniref:Zinc finger protein with KRAB and SCAN domains 8-like n=1 Tax=Clupea harengus TaxID=7950 RepID=A0A6P8GIA1_CLUHA|nr:zinc finger protein with KRAB and SCAN domains 8-like [Clupea harengus]